MWQNLGAAVGNAIQKVKKIQMDLENQLDEAVGISDSSSSNTTNLGVIDSNSEEKETIHNTTTNIPTENNADATQPKEDEDLKLPDETSIEPSVDIEKEISLEIPEQSNSITASIPDISEVAKDEAVVSTISNIPEEKEGLIEKKPNNRSTRQSRRQKKIEDSKLSSSSSSESIAVTSAATAAVSIDDVNTISPTLSSSSDAVTGAVESIPLESTVSVSTQDSVELVESSHVLPSAETPSSSSSSAAADSTTVEGGSKQNITSTELKSKEAEIRAAYESKLADIAKDHSQKLHDAEARTNKFKEVVAERERALETAMTKMHELNQQLESSQGQVKALKRDVAEKNTRLEQLSSDGDLKTKMKKLQDTLAEKEERLSAFEVEGQSLSKKQGESEKLIRQLKKDLKERGEEVGKLKESKEQFVKAIEEMQEVIRKNEAEISNTGKSMAAMAAVNQASNEKMMRLEAEINARSEELVSQRKALEVAWSESNEAKRVLVEIRAERDEFKRQLGEGNSKFMETESSRRDVEQREAILKATSKQLQDSLQRQQSDFAAREERLREEANEMRKRWQEAISSRESLATELASSTAPLLRQISSLQDSIRTKSESWQSLEASLTERAFKAEKAAEAAEKKRTVSEEQLISLKEQQELTAARLDDHKEKLLALESQHGQLQKLSAAATDQVRELQSQLYFEIGQKQNLQTMLHELEIKKNIEMQELKAALEDSVMKAEVRISQLQSEKDSYFVESNEGPRHSDTGAKTSKLSSSSSGPKNVSVVKCKHFCLFLITYYCAYLNLNTLILCPYLFVATFAESERAVQHKLRKEDEFQSINMKIQQNEVCCL